MKKEKNRRVDLKSALIGQFVIVRTFSAGVHAGILAAKKGKEVRLFESFRIWSWTQPETNTGSLSAVSQYGVGPNSKIGNMVPVVELTEAIEVLSCSQRAVASIRSGKWS